MRSACLAFFAATVTGVFLTPMVRALALRRGALDDGLSARKIHGKPVPRLGGIAIVLACVVPLAMIAALGDEARRALEPGWQALALLAGGLVIAALGIFDDLRGATARSKFTVQFAVAAGMYGLGFGIDEIATPFGEPIELGILGLPITVLWISGVINALNLVDGLDGLAGGVAFLALAVIFALAASRGDAAAMLLTAAVAGGVLGFLFYNFNPASIFMGDTGSMFLGFVLATAAIRVSRGPSSAVALLVPVVALGIPIADTLLAMTRRAVRGAPLFSADRGHLHHRLLDRGFTQRRASLAIYAASAGLGAAALVLAHASPARSTMVLAVLGVGAFAALRRLGCPDLGGRDVSHVLEARRSNVARRAAFRGIAGELHAARRVGELWAPVCAAARALDARAVELRLPKGPVFATHGSRELTRPGLFRVRFGVPCRRGGLGRIELGWDDGRTALDPVETLLAEQLASNLAHVLSRLAVANLDEHLRARTFGGAREPRHLGAPALPALRPATARRSR